MKTSPKKKVQKINKDTLRQNIDKVDTKILDLLAKRISYAKKISFIKAQNGEEIYVPNREIKIFENLSKKNAGKIEETSLHAIFREIISASIASEKKLCVGFLGPSATFTHQASLKCFGSSINYQALPSIPDVFSAVELGEVDYGVIPIENSTEGAVMHSMDMLAESSLSILGQVYMPIEHCLLSLGKMSEIKKVASKDQAIGQSRNWLHRYLPKAEFVFTESTTQAVEMASKDKSIAAIASAISSQAYGVPVLERSIQDKKDNITRFLVIGKNACAKVEGLKYKTSIVLSVNDRPGALYDALVPFNIMNINLTRIESRPSRKKAWDYYFFIDFLGHWEDINVQKAISKLTQTLPMVKCLGSYADISRY